MGVLADRRFKILGELGRGASTLVLHVRDRVHGELRALKLATERGQLRRFRNEYARLCELRHPNIVRAYDFALTPEGFPYYTMDLVEGTHVGALAGRATPHELAALTMQALEVLSVLHARGYVHRDLKPKNLLVLGEGTSVLLKLIDLGLAVPVGKRSRAAGTLPYIAPEVARGEEVDGRADLYSLGAVLYEALLPDEAARTLEDVARRLSEAPPAPSRLNPLIPEGLSAFVMRLLEPDPAARYAGAAEAADALTRITEFRLWRGPPRAVAERLVHSGVSHRRSLVTRLRKRAQLSLRERSGHAWLLEAPAGIGKTPLLRELSMVLNFLGYRVVRVATTSEPTSPLGVLLRSARVLDPDLPGDAAIGWSRQSDDTRGPGMPALVGRLGSRLAQAFGTAPTAVLIDDLQHAEPTVMELLASLARASRTVPVLLIAAREGRPTLSSADLALQQAVELVRLGPLTSKEVARLAVERLHGLHLPAPALERLVRDSEGMPILIERTLARLLIDGTVQRQGRRWVFVGGRYRPARYDDPAMVSRRVAELTPELRDVLSAAAILGPVVAAERVAAVVGLEIHRIHAALAELARFELLDPAGSASEPSYKFASRSTLAAIYHLIAPLRRRALHDRAAEALAASRRTPEPGDEEVEHLLRGGDDTRAVASAVAAAERAAVVYADRRAIEYYLRAHARLGGRRDDRAACIGVRLGKLFERKGELERAASWYDEAAVVATDQRWRVEAVLGQSGIALRRGLINEAHERAATALRLLRELPEADRRMLASAEWLQARVAAQRGEPEQAHALLQDALAAFDATGAEGAAIEVLLELARVARARGELVEALRLGHRALQRAQRVGDAAAIAEASAVLGRGLIRGARFTTAKRVLSRGLRVARASGDRLREAQLLRQVGCLRLRRGDLGMALERYTRALELVRAVQARADEVACLRDIGRVRACFGEFRPALIALQAALDLAEVIGDNHAVAHAALELGYAHAQLGQYETARTLLERGRRAGAPMVDPVLEAEGHALMAWVDAAQGDPSNARSAVLHVFDRVSAIEDPGRRALPLLYAGRCCLRLGWEEMARRASDRLQQEIETAGREDFKAVSKGLAGHVTASLGDHERAVALLEEAAVEAARSGQRPLEVELRAALGRLHRGVERGAEELTRAMELLRDIARELPIELVDAFLARAEARALQKDFAAERLQLLGGAAE